MNVAIGNSNVVNELRHSLRDKLRAVERPSAVINATEGWITTGIGHGYGNGYNLDVMPQWMKNLGKNLR